MDMKKYYDFIIEKSLGSEDIRLKHYDHLEKRKYYQIINIDPTTVTKKDFTKPGKYTKWLLYQYNIGLLSDNLLEDKTYTTALTDYLFVFSTNWYARLVGKNAIYIGGERNNIMINDINKFSLSNFMSKMVSVRDEYLIESEGAKYDVIYSDDKVDVYVPLNFTASKESSLNTQWCSQSFGGFSNWNKMAILFRIIPKDKALDKVKFTYQYNDRWFIAGPKYPELMGEGNPFTLDGEFPHWKNIKDKFYMDSYDNDKPKYDKIEKTMNLLTLASISSIIKYYNFNRK
jgi:hypothetical protein